MNRISIVGTGYVGLVTGVCLSEFGMQVTCMDNDTEKICQLKEGKLPIYEPGLESLLEKNYQAGRISFTNDMKEAVEKADTIFIAVGTPPMEDGSADLQYVLQVAGSVAEYMNDYKVIVNKSTVPVGTGQKVKKAVRKVLNQRGVQLEFDVVSNPEFLREGSAVRDFMHPDRVVIGTESKNARNIMKNIYNVLYLIDTPFVFTNIETAELIKYAANAFLATKISFINEIANLCDEVNADVHDVARAMGLDGRIGKYFLHPGPGYGGSCFPKDTRALASIGKDYGVDMNIVSTVVHVNDAQKKRMIHKMSKKMGTLSGRVIGVLGLAFKPETDDMREAPSIAIIHELVRQGCKLKVYDPIAMENAKRNVFSSLNSVDSRQVETDPENADYDIMYCSSEYHAARNADALLIITEWNQFRSLDLQRIRNLMGGTYFFDFRNVYDREKLEKLGFEYEGIGR